MEQNTTPTANLLTEIKAEINSLSRKVDTLGTCPELRREWIPRKEVMDYLGFRDTRMAFIVKKYGLRVAKIGSQYFIHNTSLLQVLNDESKAGV